MLHIRISSGLQPFEIYFQRFCLRLRLRRCRCRCHFGLCCWPLLLTRFVPNCRLVRPAAIHRACSDSAVSQQTSLVACGSRALQPIFDNGIGIVHRSSFIANRRRHRLTATASFNLANFAKQQLAPALTLISWDNTKKKKNYVKIKIQIQNSDTNKNWDTNKNINIVSSICCCCSVCVRVCCVCVCLPCCSLCVVVVVVLSAPNRF